MTFKEKDDYTTTVMPLKNGIQEKTKLDCPIKLGNDKSKKITAVAIWSDRQKK